MYSYLVGFARRDITPTQPAPLAGYGDTSLRLHTDVYDALCGTAVAVTDEDGATVLLLTADTMVTWEEYYNKLQDRIRQTLDIPAHHIHITCTHSHSAPDQGNRRTPYMAEYMANFIEKLAEAAIAAYEDRKPAQMFYSAADAEGLNFVRHYLREDGTYTGPGFGTSKAPIVAHSYAPDPELRLIRFRREGGKDVIMMNWQSHGTMNSHRRPELFQFCSADFVSGVRACMEEQENCHFIYFQGAAGDLMPTSDIEEENKTLDIYEFGKLLGAVAHTALQKETEAEGGPIRAKSMLYEGYVNHKDDHLLPQAKQVMELIAQQGNNKGSTTLAQSLGLISRHHAAAIVRRSRFGEKLGIDCAVIQIGDVGFAATSNELFSDTGIQIRKASPYNMTFSLAYTNGYDGYLPTPPAYKYHSYEVGCSNFAEGTAEDLAAYLAQELKNLKNA